MKKIITKIYDAFDHDRIYGFVIADSTYNIQDEIWRVKQNQKFWDEFNEQEWTIEDLISYFDFEFEWYNCDYYSCMARA